MLFLWAIPAGQEGMIRRRLLFKLIFPCWYDNFDIGLILESDFSGKTFKGKIKNVIPKGIAKIITKIASIHVLVTKIYCTNRGFLSNRRVENVYKF